MVSNIHANVHAVTWSHTALAQAHFVVLQQSACLNFATTHKCNRYLYPTLKFVCRSASSYYSALAGSKIIIYVIRKLLVIK